MASNTSDALCVVCSELLSSDGRAVGSKGRKTLMEVSVKRNDGQHEKWADLDKLHVHNNCYRDYTCTSSTSTSRGEKVSKESAKTLRSSTPYDYQTHCLICSQLLNFDNRHPDRNTKGDISSVEYVTHEKKCVIQEKLLKICDERLDNQAHNVKARILFAGDLRAVEAKYHRKCMQAFQSNRNIAASSQEAAVGNMDVMNDNAFKVVCEWLSTQENNQFTLNDIRQKLMEHLPTNIPAYSTRHLKRRLQEHFGDNITIAEVDGIKAEYCGP